MNAYPHTIRRGQLLATITQMRSGGFCVTGRQPGAADTIRCTDSAEWAHEAAVYFTLTGWIPADDEPLPNINNTTKK